MITRRFLLSGASLFACVLAARGEVKVIAERNSNENASAAFKFKSVPVPSKSDAASGAKFAIVDGERDGNGGDIDRLHDGRMPTGADQPGANFFFRAGSEGGRVVVDLGGAIEVKQVNTYSWHAGSRGPQVYKLYASSGSEAGFNAAPDKATDPEKAGWKVVANVDTRPRDGEPGGQYGVSISDSAGVIGKYRYLLFEMARTETTDPFGNTFYSEIDVVDRNATAVPEPAVQPVVEKVFEAEGGKYQIVMNTTAAQDLTEWAEKELAPVAIEWYPKLVKALPSNGYEAPKRVTIVFKEGMGGTPAATGGTVVNCNIEWYRRNLKGEAKGATVHELVHVVQQYGRARRTNANPSQTPGWVTEGIPDYLRWFKYEPESHGAEIGRNGLSRARYDGSYRITANFFNWASDKYGADLIPKLNAAAREGTYDEALWKKWTGRTLPELNDDWKGSLASKLGVQLAAVVNAAAPAAPKAVLTDAEKQAGWKLLFDGSTLEGWHSFKSDKVRPGWQVVDGTVACVDPHDAGDLCTRDQYGWFELQLDYNISEGGNSGIMYHVTDEGGAAWATGPEVQLEDNAKAADPQRCGWLYALYQPPIDPKTGKPLDATKPAGEWNHVRILISPQKCEHEINGVKYFDYVLGSDDFKERVAKSKFGSMPLFAKAEKGYVALQGDHGRVAFRNIKIRPIDVRK
jgi:hypothetical protein